MKKLTLVLALAFLAIANMPVFAQGTGDDKKLTFMLYGASFAIPQNGWFEIACENMGAEAINKAVSGEAIYNDAVRMSQGKNYTTDELDRTDVLVIMHVHNQNVALETNLKENYEDYAVSTSMGYAPGYDYVIKKYQADCAALEFNPDSKWYGVEGGKPAKIMLCTHWHDGRAEYNPAIRKLAEKWNFPLIEFDKNIGFSKEDNQADKGAPSREWAHDTETLYNLQFGWHPKRGANSPIQQRMAAIFTQTVAETYGYEFPFEMRVKPVSEVVLPGEDASFAVGFHNGMFPYAYSGAQTASNLDGHKTILNINSVANNTSLMFDATSTGWKNLGSEKANGEATVLVADYCAKPDFDSYVSQLSSSGNYDSDDKLQLKVGGNATRKAYVAFQADDDMPRDADKVVLRLFYKDYILGYFNNESSRPMEGVEVIGIEGNRAKYNGLNINWSTSASHNFEPIDGTAELTSDMAGHWVSIDVTDWALATLAALEEEHNNTHTGHLTFRLYIKDNNSNALMNFYSTEGDESKGPQLLFVRDATVAEEDIVTAVDEIAATDSEAIYYTLQGVKVKNPDKGLYIKVQNGKASKVIL